MHLLSGIRQLILYLAVLCVCKTHLHLNLGSEINLEQFILSPWPHSFSSLRTEYKVYKVCNVLRPS